MLKRVVLIIAFLFPVIGVIIFNFFTTNHYAVKTYFQNTPPKIDTCQQIKLPYSIDSSINFLSENNKILAPFSESTFKIIAFSEPENSFISEIDRVADAFYDIKNVRIFLFDRGMQNLKVPLSENLELLKLNDNKISSLRKCTFFFEKASDNSILIDDKNRIRGFYNLLNTDETDSLIVEAKIIIREKNLEMNGK